MLMYIVPIFLFIYVMMAILKITTMLHTRYESDEFYYFDFINKNHIFFSYLGLGYKVYYDRNNQCAKKVKRRTL